ncbi:MAG: 50S ribosomal protein L30 [Halobacteriaceae archaeon]
MQAVVQIRGEVNMQSTVEDTLAMLNLNNVNHCTFIPETETYEGMIAKVNDFVAYGEPSVETIAMLLRQRGEPANQSGDVDDDWVDENTEYADVEELATALKNEETTLSEVGISPVLRLHPPRGGHDGIKQPKQNGGQLGKHSTEQIDALLQSMR